LGIKPGDVDDSVLLEGEDSPVPVANFEVNDMLLNAGDMYSVPIFLDQEYDVLGIEFRANIDNDLISISNITSNTAHNNSSYNVTEDGILTVLIWSDNTIENIGGDSSAPVFNIEFEANENSALGLVLDMETHLSNLASSSLELIVLGGEIINAGIFPSSFICDTLPRTAAVGDCESGHTLEDDVEWPADLEIADYRISPEGLVEFSLVDVLDSKPSFYNNVDDYSSSYVDLLIDINTTTLVIGRAWTVTHSEYNFTWNYNQTITIDFSDFENLVTVNTGTNRAMPGVMINDEFATDAQGDVYVEGQPVNSLQYEDDFINGINILDLILIQRHILGLDELTEYQNLAADVNHDGEIRSSDLTQLKKQMLGIIPTEKGDWNFYSKNIEGSISVGPKGIFIGVKSGDVDDSAILQGEDPLEPTSKFEVLDILLNKGESYLIPVYLNDKIDALGLEFRAKIDADLMEVKSIASDHADSDIEYFVDEEGNMVFLFSNLDNSFEIGGASSEPVFTIEIEAKENSLLSLALDLKNYHSYIANSELELVILGGEIDNMIGTGTNSEELSSLSVYPNPASDYLNLDMRNVDVQGSLEVSVYQLNGQKLFTTFNTNRIDVADLTAGMYYYQVKIDRYTTTGKFLVVK
jgi:hypothetical protein